MGPFLESIEEDNTIFMEDGAKIHLGAAKKTRKDLGIIGFDFWPPSSPDLNPIEKVWRWMKHEITKLEIFPTTLEALRVEVQRLWDEMDPCKFIPTIESMPKKMREVKKQKGMATKY